MDVHKKKYSSVFRFSCIKSCCNGACRGKVLGINVLQSERTMSWLMLLSRNQQQMRGVSYCGVIVSKNCK